MSTQTTILHSQLSRSALNPSEEAHQPPSSQNTLVKVAKIAALILMPVAALAFLPTPFAIATVAISVFFLARMCCQSKDQTAINQEQMLRSVSVPTSPPPSPEEVPEDTVYTPRPSYRVRIPPSPASNGRIPLIFDELAYARTGRASAPHIAVGGGHQPLLQAEEHVHASETMRQRLRGPISSASNLGYVTRPLMDLRWSIPSSQRGNQPTPRVGLLSSTPRVAVGSGRPSSNQMADQPTAPSPFTPPVIERAPAPRFNAHVGVGSRSVPAIDQVD